MKYQLITSAVCFLVYLTTCSALRPRLDITGNKYFCNGECNVDRERCSCMSTCKTNKNCCTDYTESCEGGVSWTDEECTPKASMTCPDGYENTVLMLSIDGFRDIYLQRNFTPTLSKLAQCGVSSPHMISAYPTKTFPNHYSMATGLYPESHGIIANKMYNHDTEEEFRVGRESSFNPAWWKGEPIWVTASKAGLLSAAYFWPGSDVNITRYPDYWNKYDGSVDREERVYTMLDWMSKEKAERPNMIVMYISNVDTAGHNVGPYGAAVNSSLKEADKFVEMIMNGLRDRSLDTCVNFIVVSDHGMASVRCGEDVNYLADHGVNVSEVYLDIGPYARIGKSPDKSLWGKFDPLETKKKLECKREETHWEAFLKYQYLPKRYHYANDPWIEDLHLIMDKEFWVDSSEATGWCGVGNHGYDNLYDDMKAIFLAHGPGLKRMYKRSEPFENIELYNLCVDLLGIKGVTNNGTRGALYDIMTNQPAVGAEGSGNTPVTCAINTNNKDKLGCSGCADVSDDEANAKLDIDPSEATKLKQRHLLYGAPRIFDDEADFCILTQRDYITTYDKALRMPRIVSFTLGSASSWVGVSKCVRRDIRLPNDANTACSSYSKPEEVTWDFLYAPSLSAGDSWQDATVTSNTVPVYPAFMEIWTYMQNEMVRWAKLYNGITVHAGPIFDYNYDGHLDSAGVRQKSGAFVTSAKKTAIPTHFFIVMTRCKVTTSGKSISDCAADVNDIEVLTFIIPNYKEQPCHKSDEATATWIPRALVRHVARIKDVEQLTKISFFTKWVAYQGTSSDSHLAAIRRKLYLPKESSAWLKEFTSIPSNSKAIYPSFLSIFVGLIAVSLRDSIA